MLCIGSDWYALVCVCMCVYRIPLNIFVVFLLLKIKLLSSQNVFLICALAHFVSLVCYAYFYVTSKEGMQSIHAMQELPNKSSNGAVDYQRVAGEEAV